MILDNTKSVLEALLFVSEKPLTLEQIKGVLGTIQTADIRVMITELNTEYESSNRGLRITEVAGGFRMITPPSLSQFIKKLYKEKRIERLTKPALETLAIIAYKQPVTRLEIESIRDVNVDGMMRTLLEKDFVRVVGEKQAPGRPKVYGTTSQFLEYFGLKSLDDLPKMEDFSSLAPQEAVEAKEKETAEVRDESKQAASQN